MKKKYQLMVSFFIMIAVIIMAIITTINYKFNRLSPNRMYFDCFKVWAHAGHFDKYEKNSLESFERAFDLGANGTELDVFYDIDTDDFIVSHDYPYILNNGRSLKLEEVFDNFATRGYFWLDFKNLKVISKSSAKKAISKLIGLFEKYEIKNKVIIESKDPINLSIASRLGLHTSYWITPKEKKGRLKFWYNIYKYKFFLIYGEFSALSMSYKNYSNRVETIFPKIPIHLFTVNDKKTLMDLLSKESVKVILTDNSYYTENFCINK